jgi:hypothetical protein
MKWELLLALCHVLSSETDWDDGRQFSSRGVSVLLESLFKLHHSAWASSSQVESLLVSHIGSFAIQHQYIARY